VKKQQLDQTTFSLGNQTTGIDRSVLLSKAKQETLLTFVDQIFLEKEVENLKKEFQNVEEFSINAAIRLFDLKGRG